MAVRWVDVATRGLAAITDASSRLTRIEAQLLSTAPNPTAAIAEIDDMQATNAVFLQDVVSLAGSDGPAGAFVLDLITKIEADITTTRQKAVAVKEAIDAVVNPQA